MMNASNTSSKAAPERIEVFCAGPKSDAFLDGLTTSMIQQHQDVSFVTSKASIGGIKTGGPGKELTAASALTSLVKPPLDQQEDDSPEDFDIPQRFTKSGRKKATPFPVKLMKVLSNPEYADIIAWLPDGKSFAILKPKAFVAEILPGHFKQAKYSSFTRKLHRWGFQRHLRGKEAGAFFHKLFARGRLDLVEKMTCYKLDQGGNSQSSGGSGLSSSRSGNMASIRDPLLARHDQQLISRNLFLQQQLFQQKHEQLQQQQSQQQPHQSLLLQEQLLQPVNSQACHLLGGTAANAGGDDCADRLNAVIELEVNRRLKERFAAASRSRQTLELIQQQHLSGGSSDLNFGVNTINNSNMGPLALNLLGGHDGIGLNAIAMQQQQQQQYQLQQQQLQLQQLQQQQAQQQQNQLQGIWGLQPFSFENHGM